MKILVVTNYYPPLLIGGYEIRCYDLVQALGQRGHEVIVLTGFEGVENKIQEQNVLRWIPLENQRERISRWKKYLRVSELHRRIRKLVQDQKPDLIHIWNMMHVPRFIFGALRAEGIPVVFHIEDGSWLYQDFIYQPKYFRWRCRKLFGESFWKFCFASSNGLLGLKNIARYFFRWVLSKGAVSLVIGHATFPSHFRKEEFDKSSCSNAESGVIPGGIRVDLFRGPVRTFKPLFKILYVGQIYPLKGLHTLIEALIGLEPEDRERYELYVVGESPPGVNPSYLEELKDLVRQEGLEDSVHFIGKITHQDLPQVYQAHDIFVFPSIIQEGHSLSVIEAMASGLVVLSTATGGNAEIVHHEENALVFQEGHMEELQNCLKRVSSDSALFERLSRCGQQMASEKYSIENMALGMEKFFKKVISQ